MNTFSYNSTVGVDGMDKFNNNNSIAAGITKADSKLLGEVDGDFGIVRAWNDEFVERERLRSSLEPDLLEACSSVKELRKILRRIGFSAINLEYKETPLYRAALGGQLSVVQFLLAHSANGRPNRDTRQSPLYAACLNGHFEVAKLLLQVGLLQVTRPQFHRA